MTPTIVVQARAVRDAWLAERIREALSVTGGCWNRAAAQLGLDRANLRRLARRVGAR